MTELGRIQTAATDPSSSLRDLRKLLWASIDNDDSRDLDQLTVATLQPDRSVAVLVAIADVDALVTKDSALDASASDKGTWVRLLDPPVEGKLAGITRGLDVGDTVNVELISTNVERGYIDFSRVEK